MKKIALLLATLTLLCVVSACDKVGDAPSATEAPTTPATSSPVSETTAAAEEETDDFFDTARSHLPTEAEVLQVKAGMSFYAVVDLIGKPHRFAYKEVIRDVNNWIFVWETIEGEAYEIFFYPSEGISYEDIEELPLEERHKYTFVKIAPILSLRNKPIKTNEPIVDEKTNKVIKRIFYENDVYAGEEQCFYDDDVNLIKLIKLDKDGKKIYECEYDTEGNIVFEKTY